nr:PQQ-binding-like beta-propeller repeat protein [Candidatus Sigynarchaeota archaeon]
MTSPNDNPIYREDKNQPRLRPGVLFWLVLSGCILATCIFSLDAVQGLDARDAKGSHNANREPWASTTFNDSDPTGDEWPMYRGALNHTGVTTTTPINGMGALWTYSTGSMVWSSPAVTGGRVYVGSQDDKVYCLNATTGEFIWSYTTGGDVDSSPAVVNGRVYVGSQDFKIYCLDATTGNLVWSYTTGGGVDSSPAVANGRVYVGCDNAKLWCLNATTGEIFWNYTIGSLWQRALSSPAVAAGRVYMGSSDNNIYCLNATTGASIWNYTTGYYITSSPAVAGERVYVGSYDFNEYCLDAATGALIWSYTTGGGVGSSTAIADGRVYMGCEDGKIYCLDAATGAFIWSFATAYRVYSSSPAVANGRVYVGSYDSKVYCLNATTGASLWSYKTGNNVLSSPAIAGGYVYVGGFDSKIYCLPMLLPPVDPTTIAVISIVIAGAVVAVIVLFLVGYKKKRRVGDLVEEAFEFVKQRLPSNMNDKRRLIPTLGLLSSLVIPWVIIIPMGYAANVPLGILLGPLFILPWIAGILSVFLVLFKKIVLVKEVAFSLYLHVGFGVACIFNYFFHILPITYYYFLYIIIMSLLLLLSLEIMRIGPWIIPPESPIDTANIKSKKIRTLLSYLNDLDRMKVEGKVLLRDIMERYHVPLTKVKIKLRRWIQKRLFVEGRIEVEELHFTRLRLPIKPCAGEGTGEH